MRAPCQNCEERALLCHTSCPRYLLWRETVDAARAERQKDRTYTDYVYKETTKHLHFEHIHRRRKP